jgi:hypothetical protein
MTARQAVRLPAHLAGSGTLAARVTIAPEAGLAGASVLSAPAAISPAAVLTGLGTVAARGSIRSSAHLAGSGTLSSAARQRVTAAVHGAALLGSRATAAPRARLQAASSLTARPVVAAYARLEGTGALAAAGLMYPAAPLQGAGTLTAAGQLVLQVRAVLAGQSQLAALPAVLAAPLAVRRNPPDWTRDVQPWAIAQERIRHDQALYQLGELTMFALMWHIQDFEAGLVERCSTCYLDEGTVSAAYGQGNQYRCPDCLGTTFEGGFRALIIRPAIYRDLDQDQRHQARGVTNESQTSIESTADFIVRTGDYCLRITGDRFFLRVPRRTTLRTGFSVPWMAETAIDYVHANAVRQDPSSPAYIIFPDSTRLLTVLQSPGRLPAGITGYANTPGRPV